jgi:hypothetical protein
VTSLKVTIDIPDPGRIEAVVGEAVTLESMRVNGKRLSLDRARQHRSSQDLLVVGADGLFVCGSNEITFQRLQGDVLFEPFYLMGDFTVELIETGKGTRPAFLGKRPQFGDLVASGLPFYWGNVRYQCMVDGAAEWIDCGAVDGVVTLRVNGKMVGCRYAAPYRFRIADGGEPGMNQVDFELSNTAQNLYGPHRRLSRDPLDACVQHGEYYLARFGIQGPVSLESEVLERTV